MRAQWRLRRVFVGFTGGPSNLGYLQLLTDTLFRAPIKVGGGALIILARGEVDGFRPAFRPILILDQIPRSQISAERRITHDVAGECGTLTVTSHSSTRRPIDA